MSELTPKTREQAYWAKLGGHDVELPEPKTRMQSFMRDAALNGGGGDGDMKKSVYDADGSVEEAGGIAEYVEAHSGGGGGVFAAKFHRESYGSSNITFDTELNDIIEAIDSGKCVIAVDDTEGVDNKYVYQLAEYDANWVKFSRSEISDPGEGLKTCSAETVAYYKDGTAEDYVSNNISILPSVPGSVEDEGTSTYSLKATYSYGDLSSVEWVKDT